MPRSTMPRAIQLQQERRGAFLAVDPKRLRRHERPGRGKSRLERHGAASAVDHVNGGFNAGQMNATASTRALANSRREKQS